MQASAPVRVGRGGSPASGARSGFAGSATAASGASSSIGAPGASSPPALRATQLELAPGRALGPFALGASLWRTLAFLRAEHDTYPRVRVRWDAHAHAHTGGASADKASKKGPASGDTTAQAHRPLVVSASEHLHLAFDAVHQRLQSIVLDDLSNPSKSASNGIATGAHASALMSEHGLQTDTHSNGAKAHADAAWVRPFEVTYRGRRIYASGSSGGSGSGAVHASVSGPAPAPLTRAAVQQLLGPTYPGEERARGGADESGVEFVLSYPGVAFGFPLAGSADAAGANRHVPAAAIYVFRGKTPFDAADGASSSSERQALSPLLTPAPGPAAVSSSAAGARARSPLRSASPADDSVGGGAGGAADGSGGGADAAARLLDEPLWVEDAVIYPGQGVLLSLGHTAGARSSAAERRASPDGTAAGSKASAQPQAPKAHAQTARARHAIPLAIGRTTVQDALCELGPPDARCWKEDERMGIHRAQYAGAANGGDASKGAGTSAAPHAAQAYRAAPAQARARSGRAQDDEDEDGPDDDDDGDAASPAQLVQPFFLNYFSLGFDLLFEDPAAASTAASPLGSDEDPARNAPGAAPVLSKIICHSNTPGHTLFGRYQRLPWRFARAGAKLPKSGDASAVPAPSSGASEYMQPYAHLASSGALPQAPVVSAQHAQRETMLLDRAADAAEFRDLLRLDVASSLHGHPGAVLEVAASDGRVACVTVLANV